MDPLTDDGASPADDDWIEQGHEPGPDITAEELANVDEWERSRMLVAQLDPDDQRTANEQTYAAILKDAGLL